MNRSSEYVIKLFKDIGIHKDGKGPSISASGLSYKFSTVLEEISGRINHEQSTGREIIAGVLLRVTRIIANAFLTKKEKTSSGNQTFQEMSDVFAHFIEATKGIAYAHKSDSKDSRVYDELNNLNNPLIDAISRLEEHFVPWNDLIMSGSIKYNQEELSAEIILLENNVKQHVTKSVLHNNIVKNIKIVKEYMSKFGSNAMVKKDGIFHQETNYDPVVGDGVDVEEEYESVDDDSVDDKSGYESSLSSVGVDLQGEGLKKKKRQT